MVRLQKQKLPQKVSVWHVYCFVVIYSKYQSFKRNQHLNSIPISTFDIFVFLIFNWTVSSKAIFLFSNFYSSNV
jgi:hypothetical protein